MPSGSNTGVLIATAVAGSITCCALDAVTLTGTAGVQLSCQLLLGDAGDLRCT